jgi:FlaA1/EpsC-like NDP-sugar epimerase
MDTPQLRYQVRGFLDDDPKKHGRSLHGVPVLGSVAELTKIAPKEGIQEVLIAIPSARGHEMRRVAQICKDASVPHKTLPTMGEIVEGKVSIKTLRDVDYQDLLGRSPVRLDMEDIKRYLGGKTVLVTGCGGSIGSELCRQLLRFSPKELVLLDASEANLFQIQMEIHHEKGFHTYETILGRVQDRVFVEEVLDRYLPEVVFHAAAYKHVPMLECNPWEAVRTNILGSQVMMEAAIKYDVKHFVLVSTDKAVRPTNVMGASKRVAELILQSLQGNGTYFMAVRFGNVVGSSGSVIPLFRRQIEYGGPVTVTHPEITRYFMTISEAAQLILQAGALGKGGEVFILEMGIPVKIRDMARDLIRLSGKEPGKDIEIIFTGLREGEKLYEELITKGEDIVRTRHEKILALNPNGCIGGFSDHEALRSFLEQKLQELLDVAEKHDARAIKKLLSEIVPEYCPQETRCVLESEFRKFPSNSHLLP